MPRNLHQVTYSHMATDEHHGRFAFCIDHTHHKVYACKRCYLSTFTQKTQEFYYCTDSLCFQQHCNIQCVRQKKTPSGSKKRRRNGSVPWVAAFVLIASSRLLHTPITQALLNSTSKAHPVLLHTRTPLGGGFQAHLRNGAEMQQWLGKSPGKTQEGVARRLLPEYKWAVASSECAQTTWLLVLLSHNPQHGCSTVCGRNVPSVLPQQRKCGNTREMFCCHASSPRWHSTSLVPTA